MSNSRTKNVTLNIVSKMTVTLVLTLLRFWSRSVFFQYLGDDVLGLNSLFQDILTILGFSDLGFYSVIMVSLYEPIANNDIPKIQSILEFSKKVYRYVMLAITCFGLLTIPIYMFVNTNVPLQMVILYYLIMLINNVCSYLWAYRETYIQANQKQYKLFYINFIISVSSVVFRTIVLMKTGNYALYLVNMFIFNMIQKVLYNRKIKQVCPEVIYDHAEPVGKELWQSMVRKSKAMLVQRLSILGIAQTDSFIVSVVLNSAAWGVVSNYNLINSSIENLLTTIFGSIIPSMGNVMNSESREKQLSIFYQYDLLNNLLYIEICSVIFCLINPLLVLLFDNTMLMTTFQCVVFFVNVYIMGLKTPINVMRESSGMFEKDQWVAVLACAINLVTSVIFIRIFGLVGVFFGTILSSLTFILFGTVIFFKSFYDTSCILPYFRTMMINVLQCAVIWFSTYKLYSLFLENRIGGFVGLFINGVILGCFSLFLFIVINLYNPNLKALFNRAMDIVRRFTKKAHA